MSFGSVPDTVHIGQFFESTSIDVVWVHTRIWSG